jgi:ribosome maturation factor RimP
MTSPAQSIDELVLPLVNAAGLELWDVDVNPRVVRVLVDRPGGVDLEAITGLARAVSDAFDSREDLAPSSNYQLEVSSPGIERTLRTPAHYQRYIGSTIAVKTAVLIAGTRRLEGVLVAADDAGITIKLEDGGPDEGPTQLTYEQIQKARAVLVWGPAPKKSAAKGPSTKSTAGKSKTGAASAARRGTGSDAGGDQSNRMKDVAR